MGLGGSVTVTGAAVVVTVTTGVAVVVEVVVGLAVVVVVVVGLAVVVVVVVGLAVVVKDVVGLAADAVVTTTGVFVHLYNKANKIKYVINAQNNCQEYSNYIL